MNKAGMTGIKHRHAGHAFTGITKHIKMLTLFRVSIFGGRGDRI